LAKAKLQKFEEISKMPNVFQNTHWGEAKLINHLAEPVQLKGNWSAEVFNNTQPIILELACGKGEYSTALGLQYPNTNFIGIDLKGNRIWNGANKALQEKLNNVRFVRTRIEVIQDIFAEKEVDEIWITFPDPYLKKSKSQKRLSSARFLNLYKPILKKDGIIHLKTDSQPLYEFTKATIQEENLELLLDIPDVYADASRPEILNIKTYYEGLHLANGLKITYLKFKFKA